MRILSSKSGLMRTVVIVLVVIVVVGSIVAAYIVLELSSPSSTHSHVVPWQEMANSQTDYWNITATKAYTVLLNDSMTVSGGNQWLTITARSTGNFAFIWSVVFMNQTYFQYSSAFPVIGGYQYDRGYLSCSDGVVHVVVNSTAITYTGTASHVSNVTFTDLAQIQTENGDGNFNGGRLNMDVH
jgi:hypothetical protein